MVTTVSYAIKGKGINEYAITRKWVVLVYLPAIQRSFFFPTRYMDLSCYVVVERCYAVNLLIVQQCYNY